MDRAKAGLLLLTAEWFAEIGASRGYYKKLPGLIDGDAKKTAQILKKELNIVNPGVIDTKEKVDRAVKLFRRENIDILIICYLTWGEDRLIIEAVEKLSGIPVLLWCYSPFRKLPKTLDMVDLFRSSGPVGTVQASAPLKRMGKTFGFVFGSYKNKKTVKKIVDYSKAAKLASDLRKVTIGLLPYRCDAMTGTYVDEFRLKKEIGPEIKYISVQEYYSISQKIPEGKIEGYVKELKENYKISKVSDKALFKGARASLGLAEVVKKFGLDALALEDLNEELHEVMGLRPCLYVPSLFDRAVVSMEGEIGAAVALLILKKLTCKPPMYTEIFTYDEGENAILAGHAGIHDINLAGCKTDVTIAPDAEYMEAEPETCWMQFRAKEGEVTLLSLFCDVDKFKMVISSGHALSGKEKLHGSPHIYIKLKTPLEEFFEKAAKTGMTQHWAVVHEDVVNQLEYLADILNLDKLIIE